MNNAFDKEEIQRRLLVLAEQAGKKYDGLLCAGPENIFYFMGMA